jgi:hypothetical protein
MATKAGSVCVPVVLLHRCGSDCSTVFEVDCLQFWTCTETAERTLSQAEAVIASRVRGGPQGAEYTLSIPAAGPCGFRIILYADPYGIHAWFGGLEQEFTSVEEAMPWVRRAMSRTYRLHIVLVGRKPAEWLLEDVSGQHPVGVLGSSRLTLFKRLRGVRDVYRSNGSADPERQSSIAAPAHSVPIHPACPGVLNRGVGGIDG